jgi:hypothetical protein
VFSSVAADEAERRAARPGDDMIARPDVVMDRAFTVAAAPAAIWPWLVQLGKQRAGWYLPLTPTGSIVGCYRRDHAVFVPR